MAVLGFPNAGTLRAGQWQPGGPRGARDAGAAEAGPAHDDNEVSWQDNIIMIFMNENIIVNINYKLSWTLMSIKRLKSELLICFQDLMDNVSGEYEKSSTLELKEALPHNHLSGIRIYAEEYV